MFDTYYIYILYSLPAKAYYIGHSIDPIRRLEEHNSKPFNTYTSKFRPWVLAAVFDCGPSRKEAMRLEKFIKAQKSRKLTEQLIDPSFIPKGALAQLVRVPHLRD